MNEIKDNFINNVLNVFHKSELDLKNINDMREYNYIVNCFYKELSCILTDYKINAPNGEIKVL